MFEAQDHSSRASALESKIVHVLFDWTVDFGAKIIKGTVKLNFKALKSISSVCLDLKCLKIHQVTDSATTGPLVWTLGTVTDFRGVGITIDLSAPMIKGDLFSITILYETTETGTALQWLSPEQTVGQKLPYLFTQCQAIHARSLFPCQDTPAVKFTYEAIVRVKRGMRALMSAVLTGDCLGRAGESPAAVTDSFYFSQKVPIPSYLLALAVGNIEGRQVGPRTTVWSEPEVVEAAASEFRDTNLFLKTAEELLTPYVWGVYDIVVLPASFPFGGMENPCLTFLTPSLLAGDRSLVDVVAHEISHSWMGNLVGCANWQDFWLNEGWTMFVERKIMARIGGEAVRQFDSIVGLTCLQDSVDVFACQGHSEYTLLVPDLQGVDPDDVFSSVPYEKGYNLLYYLESLVGVPAFESYMRQYVQDFSFMAITTAQFKKHFLNYFEEVSSKVKVIDWDLWLYGKGMPPIPNAFARDMVIECESVAEAWAKGDISQTESKWNAMTTNQKVMVFEKLGKTSITNLDKIDAMGKLSEVNNVEIKFKWQMTCVQSGKDDIFPSVVEFITTAGRMKYVRPLYRALNASKHGRELALSTFEKHKAFYHPICSGMVSKDLGL